MKLMKPVLQILGVVVLVPMVALATLRYMHRNDDGATILFPGGELVSGDLYNGPEPDWSFTDAISTIELQLNNPVSSRIIWILESDGKIYIASGYMRSFLGRLWKHWAVAADAGDGTAVVRIDGVRYPRQLRRVTEGPELEGVAAKMGSKYRSPTTRAAIEAGDTWIFELAPPATGGGA